VKLSFTQQGWEDCLVLRDDDKGAHKKQDSLIKECLRNPYIGTGKPEPLKSNLKGWWSRRVTQEHRLVYRVIGSGDDQILEVSQCRLHY
jgi:toxin YoeB